MRRIAFFVAGALLCTLASTDTASAHANLVRSEPASGAVLDSAPDEAVLEFTEDLDPAFTWVDLLNSRGEVVVAGPGAIDPSSPRMLRLRLEPLPDGAYALVWKARSAQDGHNTRGSIPFGIRVAPAIATMIPPPEAPNPMLEVPPIADSTARWLALLLAAIALGGFPFALMVWRPAVVTMKDSPTTHLEADRRLTEFVRRSTVWGGLAFLLVNGLFLLNQAAVAAEVPLRQALGPALFELLPGQTGQVLLIRVGLMLAIILMTERLPLLGHGRVGALWLEVSLAGLLLLTFCLNSHAAALGQSATMAITADWLHLVAMVAWLGGLWPLSSAIRMSRTQPGEAVPLAALIPRFSTLALACVAILSITGVYSSVLHIRRVDLLAATTYGRALLLKLLFFGGLLLLGAVNLRVLSPRLRTAGNRLARPFGRTVRAELALGAAVLLVVGVMTSVAPSLTATEARQQQFSALVDEANIDGVSLALWATPRQVGDNQLAVDVLDSRPGAASAPTEVLLRLESSEMDMGTEQVEAQTTDGVRFTARGNYFSMAGQWEVEIIVRRPGFDDVRHIVTLMVAEGAR
jgi:copper transport protein